MVDLPEVCSKSRKLTREIDFRNEAQAMITLLN